MLAGRIRKVVGPRNRAGFGYDLSHPQMPPRVGILKAGTDREERQHSEQGADGGREGKHASPQTDGPRLSRRLAGGLHNTMIILDEIKTCLPIERLK